MLMRSKHLYVVGTAVLTAGLIVPFNGAPLLAQVINQSSTIVAPIVSQVTQRPKVDLQLSAERALTQTINGKPSVQWQALDSKQAAVLPGNVLRYTLVAKNSGSAIARNFVITQAMPQRTTLVANSVQVPSSPSATVIYSIDNGKTFTAKPMIQVQGKAEAAPITSYTHLQIRTNQSIAPKATLTAQYQLRVK
jgi:uncharacterized repeat protein (TIGR01451 family)